MVQKYEERLETARKSTRKWQRTLKYNGLYGSTWIKNDQVLIFLLKIFGVLANICFIAHEYLKLTIMTTQIKFMNERLQHEMDKLWKSGDLSDEKMQKLQSEHLRTAYK